MRRASGTLFRGLFSFAGGLLFGWERGLREEPIRLIYAADLEVGLAGLVADWMDGAALLERGGAREVGLAFGFPGVAEAAVLTGCALRPLAMYSS